jgi:hypothetical protein
MTLRTGAILSEEAYALGKMLDHTAWQRGDRVLPRGITGSDIDFVLDNNGHEIIGELTRTWSEWKEVTSAQRRVYEGLVRWGAPHVAVLCRHEVNPDERRAISPKLDVASFQPMLCDHRLVVGRVFRGNALWQAFVESWFRDPVRLRHRLLGLCADMRPRVAP